MKYAKHDEAFAIVSVPKDIGRVQDPQHNLAKIYAALYRSSQLGMLNQYLSLHKNFGANDRSEAWIPIVKK